MKRGSDIWTMLKEHMNNKISIENYVLESRFPVLGNVYNLLSIGFSMSYTATCTT